MTEPMKPDSKSTNDTFANLDEDEEQPLEQPTIQGLQAVATAEELPPVGATIVGLSEVDPIATQETNPTIQKNRATSKTKPEHPSKNIRSVNAPPKEKGGASIEIAEKSPYVPSQPVAQWKIVSLIAGSLIVVGGAAVALLRTPEGLQSNPRKDSLKNQAASDERKLEQWNKPLVEKPPEPKKPAHVHELNPAKFWIEAWSSHAADVELNPRKMYSLQLKTVPQGGGKIFARLESPTEWGTMQQLASHHPLKISKTKTLRLHCEPGTKFTESATFDLELKDGSVATPLRVLPAQHCMNYENAMRFDLKEGSKYLFTLSETSKAVLGNNQALQVAYRVRSAGEPITWTTGILDVGTTVEVEGALIQAGVFDSLASDNTGVVHLELIPKDK
jgi:hypothetical protein